MIPNLSAADVFGALPPAAAVAAIETALRTNIDPAAAIARSSVPLDRGELLLMPATSPDHAGVKLATVAPGNPALGLPRINALYVLFDATTLLPSAVLDGTALTTLRTPAVSAAVLRGLLPRPSRRLVVFGAGPQGTGHLATLSALFDLVSVDVVVRSVDRRAASPNVPGPSGAVQIDPRQAGSGLTGSGLDSLAGPEVRLLRAGSTEVATALREADVVVCATTAREPLFDSALLPDHAVVLAIGSHEPTAREVDAAFCARATVIVEDVATALRECGDVILAIADGSLAAQRLIPMRDLVRGTVAVGAGPVLFKGSGMSWQDLVIAEAILARVRG